MNVYVSNSVKVKLDEYVEFLMRTCLYNIDEAETRRWEVEFQITQHCNPILMKPSTSGTLKFKSVLQTQEIKRFIKNRTQLSILIKRRKGNKGNIQWTVEYIVSDSGDVFITAIKCYNTFSESFHYQDLHQLINECIEKCLEKYLLENATNTLMGIDYLYHATPSCYVNSIKKYGLGGKIPKTRLWDYDGTEYETITQGCFLDTDEYAAESYVECSDRFDELADMYADRYDEELEIVVFRISVSDLDLNLLSVDSNNKSTNDATYFYSGVIPYNKLKRVKLY